MTLYFSLIAATVLITLFLFGAGPVKVIDPDKPIKNPGISFTAPDGKMQVLFSVDSEGHLKFDASTNPGEAGELFAKGFNRYFPDLMSEICINRNVKK